MFKINYTREELIALIERSVVEQHNWHDRDTANAQMKAGSLLFLLKAGCEFKILGEGKPRDAKTNSLATDDRTIWIEVVYHGFQWFESLGDDWPGETETFYIPTDERLKEADGIDWY